MNKGLILALNRALDGVGSATSVEVEDGVAAVQIRRLAPSGGSPRELRLRALWAGAGWPAEVERAIGRIGKEWPSDLVVVARSFSVGSRQALESRGASWVDAGGAARLVLEELVVVRDVRQRARAKPRGLSWSPSAVLIAEALLDRESPSGVRTSELAALTGFSKAQVSGVLSFFDAQGWTAKWGPQRGPRASRHIADSTGLLDAWSERVNAVVPELRLAERIVDDPTQLLARELAPALRRHGIEWALTGWAAAELLAPYVASVPSLQLYVDERSFRAPLTSAIEEIRAREAQSGGRIEFRSADPMLLKLARRRDDFPLASAPRVFADLRALRGRAEDAAAHLREEVIAERLRRPWARTLPPQARAQLERWDRRCRARLRKRIDEVRLEAGFRSAYEGGTWSVAYRIPGVELSLAELGEALVTVEGRETGWPPWWVPTPAGIRPEVRDGGIGCWLPEASGRQRRHSGFWRAEPRLTLFLLRSYQEDGITAAPGSALDPVFTTWRIAEALLHAARMARHVKAERVEAFARWDRIAGRQLREVLEDRWSLPPGLIAQDESVTAALRIDAEELDRELPSAVRALVEPLFAAFGLREAPGALYATEIKRMIAQSPVRHFGGERL